MQILFVHRPFGYLTPTKLVLLLLQHKVKKQGYYEFSECPVGIFVFNGFSAFIAKSLVYILRTFELCSVENIYDDMLSCIL